VFLRESGHLVLLHPQNRRLRVVGAEIPAALRPSR